MLSMECFSAKDDRTIFVVLPLSLPLSISLRPTLTPPPPPPSGVVAVPVYPPNMNDLASDLPKLKRIVADCDARTVLTTSG